MCGRFNLDPQNWAIADILQQLPDDFPKIKTGEVFPGDLCLGMVTANGALQPTAMRWGFPRRESRGLIINARSETALQRPMFRMALKERRIAIPSTGFYEWRALPESRHKQKLLIQNNEDPLTWLAAIWNLYPDDAGEQAPRFSILTRDATPFIREFHDRMPVVLTRNELSDWLGSGEFIAILAQTPPPLKAESTGVAGSQQSLLQ